MTEQNITAAIPFPSATAEPIASSNAIRLSIRQWLGVGLFAAALIAFGPWLWKWVEPFPSGPDYRFPNDLKEDYWLYERIASRAAEECDTVVIGDSVVWGVYVTPNETLSFHLSRPGRIYVANLGLVGAHPLALEGLVEHYAGIIGGKNVLLQCNPLWLTSRELDLQDRDKPAELFHPRLLPQFWPTIPRYKQELSPRIGIVVEHHLGFNSWTTHLQQAYYDRTDIPGWTMEHPYDNPFAPLARGLPASDHVLQKVPQPWYKAGITKQDYPWIDMETSLQWPAFQRVVETLQRRGNRVFVLVGPFNEHMLKPASLARYQEVKGTIAAWLKAKEIPHAVPAPLASELYGDASHPLAAGYAELARQLRAEPFFR